MFRTDVALKKKKKVITHSAVCLGEGKNKILSAGLLSRLHHLFWLLQFDILLLVGICFAL